VLKHAAGKKTAAAAAVAVEGRSPMKAGAKVIGRVRPHPRCREFIEAHERQCRVRSFGGVFRKALASQ